MTKIEQTRLSTGERISCTSLQKLWRVRSQWMFGVGKEGHMIALSGSVSLPLRGYFAGLLAAAICLAAAEGARSQDLYGGIVGVVKDAQGGILPGAAVVVVNRDTGLKRETVTNAEGAYTFTNVQSGPYDVRITMSGFREALRSNVPVAVGQISRVDVTLEIGGLKEVVEVTSPVQLLQTDKADVRSEIKAVEITNLPLNQYPELPGAHQPRSRIASGRHAQFGNAAPSAIDQLHGQRAGRGREHDTHRRDQSAERLPAEPSDVHLTGRDDRVGQYRRRQHGCRTGRDVRRSHHRDDEVGHEYAEGFGVRILQQPGVERRPVLLRPRRGAGQAAGRAPQCRGYAWRTDRPESPVLLRCV